MEVNIQNLDIEKLLKSRLINRAELARELYPNTEYAPTQLDAKLRQSQGRRITPKDQREIEALFIRFLRDIGIADPEKK